MIHVANILSICFILLSVYVRNKKNGGSIDLSDGFYLFVASTTLYYVLGQYSKIDLDNFNEEIYLIVAMVVLASFFVLFICSIVLPVNLPAKSKFTKKVSFYGDERLPIILLFAALVSLTIGYVFWYLNFSRIGGIIDSITNVYNRIDRNSVLSEQRGNLPYTHFFHVGWGLLLSSAILKGIRFKTALILSLLVISPLLIFYLIEGERSALLKYVISSLFIFITLSYRKPLNLSFKYISIFLGVFMLFGLLGNIRGSMLLCVGTGDCSRIPIVLSEKKLAIFVPKEYGALNFTFDRIVNDVYYDKRQILYGESYLKDSFTYLFPRSIYDNFGLKKEKTISNKLGEHIAKEMGRTRKLGFGMSGFGEAYANFSYFGPPLFILFGMLIVCIFSRMIKSDSIYIALFASLLSSMLMTMHRSSFASIFNSFVWIMLIMIFSIVASVIVINLLWPNRRFQKT